MTQIQINTRDYDCRATRDGSGFFIFEHNKGTFEVRFNTDCNDQCHEISIIEPLDEYGESYFFELNEKMHREICQQIDCQFDDELEVAYDPMHDHGMTKDDFLYSYTA